MLTEYDAVHVGVATMTEAGLMVPVVKHCEVMDVWQVAAEVGRVSRLAREGEVSAAELTGSTITITSLMIYSVREQSCFLPRIARTTQSIVPIGKSHGQARSGVFAVVGSTQWKSSGSLMISTPSMLRATAGARPPTLKRVLRILSAKRPSIGPRV